VNADANNILFDFVKEVSVEEEVAVEEMFVALTVPEPPSISTSIEESFGLKLDEERLYASPNPELMLGALAGAIAAMALFGGGEMPDLVGIPPVLPASLMVASTNQTPYV